MEDNSIKWIVYLTINIITNKIYIGIHKTINPNVFDGYIGCGVNINRPSTYKRSKTPFQYAVNKYGIKAFKRITLMIVDTLDDALKIETILVNKEFVKRRDTYNAVLGGGTPLTGEEGIEVHQYDLNGNYIKTWKSTEDAARYFNITGVQIRVACKINRTSCGYFWSTILYNKLDISKYKSFIKRDKIYKFDITGKLVTEYNNIKEAANDNDNTSRLILNAIAGKSKSRGFYYSYNRDFIIDNSVYNRLTNIYLYNLDGTFYKEFSSPRECADFFNDKKTSRIYTAIRTGGLYKNLQISKEKLPFMKSIEKCNEKKKVAQYDLNGNLIKIWNSIQEPFLVYGAGVKKCLRGQQNKTKGYVFKYYKKS